jgi:formylglycine-generating enzyme required for sulfatase activity
MGSSSRSSLQTAGCLFSLGAGILLCAAVVRAEPAARPGDPRRHALLVAVDDYARMKDLRFCGSDLRALRDALIASDFPAERTILICDDAPDAAHRPTRANIEKQIALLLEGVREEDFVLIAFSGHAVQSKEVASFCPADGDLDDPDSLVRISGAGGVYEQLQNSNADLKVVLFDTGHDDPRLAGSRSGQEVEEVVRFARAVPPFGIVRLRSCGPGETSRQDPQLQHGVFMHSLLAGLAGKGDRNGDGYLSLDELTTFASRETKAAVRLKFSGAQSPDDVRDCVREIRDFRLARVRSATLEPTGDAARKTSPAPARDLEKNVTNSIGMKLTLIPAGEFVMGSPETEEGHWINDPQHRVRMTQPFYLGVYEVTQGEYGKVMGAGANPSWFSPGNFGKKNVRGIDTSRLPVEYVTWTEAAEFCRKLSNRPDEKRAGRRYRLPTEAEWEYACRAGTVTPFHFGSALNGHEANCLGDRPYGTTEKGPVLLRPAVVGSYRPNAFGLYDMHGNVGEWCHDWYGEAYYRTAPQADPRGPDNGTYRVIRGGGSGRSAGDARSAIRNAESPSDQRSDDVGFRVAVSPSGE